MGPTMTPNGPITTATARRIDDAAYGILCGSITLMALWMRVHRPVEAPGRQELILLGPVLAGSLAKA